MTTNQVIPAEAVEAAYDKYQHLGLNASDIEGILEAAAPHMMAEGWDAAADDIRHDTSIGDRTYVAHRIKANNPYMLNTEGEE